MKKDLFLKSIRIKNFKSYKNLTEAGPFHPKINIIIGPNGTGKSNFLDSILFVLGKRAGQLRFKKLSDTINLKNIKKNGFGSVSLIFCENFKDFITKKNFFTEIIFSRQIFLDNISYYFLNGREISFSNLIKSLKIMRICVKNDRFLIQQGEIEKISIMKSKNRFSSEIGMLEYTEDSFGSSRYVKDLNKKKKKIFKLQKVKKFSLKFRKLKNGFKSKKIKFLKKLKILSKIRNVNIQKKWETISKKVLLKEKISEISISLTFRLTMYNLFKENYQLNEKKIKNIKSAYFFGKFLKLQIQKIFVKIKKKISNLKKKKNEIEKKQIKKKINQRNLKKLILNQKIFFLEINRYEKKFGNTYTCFYRLKKKMFCYVYFSNYLLYFSQKFQQFENLYFQIFFEKNLNLNKEEFEKIILVPKKKKGSFSNFGLKYFSFLSFCRNSFLYRKNYSLDQNFHLFIFLKKKIQKFFFLFYPEIFLYSTDYSIFFFSQIKFSLNIREIDFKRKEKLKIHVRKKDFISKNLYILKKKIADLNLNYSEENIKIFISVKILSRKENPIDFKKIKIPKKIRKFDMLNKNVPGIIGTIGTLGFIKFYYSVSFFSFLLGAFNTILIDTYSNCSKAIEFLQKNKIGRSVFMVYEKLEKFKVSIPFFREIKTIYLVDLLFCEKKFKSLFYNILRDTILVKNLTEGITLSKKFEKRKRVVTLDGKQIEISGIFSGGGIIQNVISFLKPDQKKNILWINRIENSFYECRCSRELIKKFNFHNGRSLDGNWDNQKKKKSVPFFYFFKLFTKNKRNYSIKMIEKNLNISFKKKIIFLENKKFMNCIFFRKINVGIGKLFPILLINKKIGKMSQNFWFSISYTEFSDHFNSNLKYIFDNKKKTKLYKINKDLTSLKHFGKILKKNFKIIKFFEIFYIYFIIASLEKKLEFEKFFSVYERTTILKKENLIILEQSIKNENYKKFEKIKKLRLEIKSNFWFFLKYRKLENTSIIGRIFKKNEKMFGEIVHIDLKCQIFQKKKKILFFSMLGLEKMLYLNYENYVKLFKDSFHIKSKEFNFKKGIQEKIFLVSCNHYIHLQRYTDYLLDFFAFELNIKKIFPQLSNGGIMEINMIDFTDPFTEGVSLSIKPSQKTWRFISFLSGGEKTLSSLAVVFSIQDLKPTSWYLLDEIDAALDFKNVGKVSFYLMIQSYFCQILIVSLRNNMLAKANHIIGVFRIYSGTKIISYRK